DWFAHHSAAALCAAISFPQRFPGGAGSGARQKGNLRARGRQQLLVEKISCHTLLLHHLCGRYTLQAGLRADEVLPSPPPTSPASKFIRRGAVAPRQNREFCK